MEPGADLSATALGDLIGELIERLGLEQVTIVGNDTGGALTQIAVAAHPQRIARIVLTNCDSFEHFPPPAFAGAFKLVARVPGAIKALELGGRSRRVRRRAMALAPLTVQPIPDELLAAWISPLRDAGVRRDLRKVAQGISSEHTLAAAEKLRSFEGSALIGGGSGQVLPARRRRATRAAVLGRAARADRGRARLRPVGRAERLAELILELEPAIT